MATTSKAHPFERTCVGSTAADRTGVLFCFVYIWVSSCFRAPDVINLEFSGLLAKLHYSIVVDDCGLRPRP
jgi:hypothetical protein